MLKLFKRRRPAHRANGLMSGRESVAYAMAYEACQGSRLDMLEFENNPLTRAGWLAAADRKLTTDEDVRVAAAWGLNLRQWTQLTEWDRAEARRTITAAPRFQP